MGSTTDVPTLTRVPVVTVGYMGDKIHHPSNISSATSCASLSLHPSPAGLFTAPQMHQTPPTWASACPPCLKGLPTPPGLLTNLLISFKALNKDLNEAYPEHPI